MIRLSGGNLSSLNASGETSQKQALSGLSLPELEKFVADLGMPAYRAKQIHSWIYSKYAQSFEQMSDLSAGQREKLDAIATVPLLRQAHLQVSQDATRKYLFELDDGKIVESVLMSFQ